jgi:hypothetical protein
MNESMRCRLRGKYLSESYSILFRNSLAEAYENLTKGAQQQITDIFEKYLSPDYKKMNRLLEKIEHEKNKQYNKNKTQFEKTALDSAKKFEHTFNRFDRPVLGVYDDQKHTFKIINTDQMYKNGEESDKQIKLKSMSKNSPVIITLIVTGTMLSFIGYLIFRDHKVNNETVDNEMLDIPQDSKEVINNIFCSSNGAIVNLDLNNYKKLDPQLISIIEKNFNKLENITNNRKVNLEIHKN